ncbi:hypothetical protein BKA62DRAFT_510166 [Auriculariales sp. MPI-PUGE-AT-0066]|nr:hypothetical protein BKA62DRAFT_510166 [Auriculariales sp. MPI-PUGE-AT-0066]
MTTVDSWDQSVRTSTFNFVYEDSTVWLRIGNERFKVSRRRLCTASPVFATMFELLKDKEAIVILHNNVHEFKDFLWYLHVSHTDFKEYNAKCAPKKRYHRALNIASIAHFYQATAITEWAVSELFELRPSCGALDLETLKKMHEFASRYGDRPDFLPWVQEYWCDQVDESEDPVGWLVAAKEVRNTYLQAYAYFYVLRKSNSVLRDDNRLTMLDRMRLHMGAANLQRHGLEGYKCDSTMWDGHTPAYIPPSRRNTYTGDVCDPRSWLPRTNTPLRKLYDGVSLWNMFTRSPMGLDLPDGTEISIPASSSS